MQNVAAAVGAGSTLRDLNIEESFTDIMGITYLEVCVLETANLLCTGELQCQHVRLGCLPYLPVGKNERYLPRKSIF